MWVYCLDQITLYPLKLRLLTLSLLSTAKTTPKASLMCSEKYVKQHRTIPGAQVVPWWTRLPNWPITSKLQLSLEYKDSSCFTWYPQHCIIFFWRHVIHLGTTLLRSWIWLISDWMTRVKIGDTSSRYTSPWKHVIIPRIYSTHLFRHYFCWTIVYTWDRRMLSFTPRKTSMLSRLWKNFSMWMTMAEMLVPMVCIIKRNGFIIDLAYSPNSLYSPPKSQRYHQPFTWWCSLEGWTPSKTANERTNGRSQRLHEWCNGDQKSWYGWSTFTLWPKQWGSWTSKSTWRK